jgi:hypothetical protein
MHTFHNPARFIKNRLVRRNLRRTLAPHKYKISILDHRRLALECLIFSPYPTPRLTLILAFGHCAHAPLNRHYHLFVALAALHGDIAD